MFILSQIPPPAAGSIETWLLSAAAVGSMVILAQKLFLTKRPPMPEFLTKTEFHHEMTIIRDKIDARFLSLAEKLDQTKTDLHTAGEQRGLGIHRRLSQVEASIARLDERTKGDQQPLNTKNPLP